MGVLESTIYNDEPKQLQKTIIVPISRANVFIELQSQLPFLADYTILVSMYCGHDSIYIYDGFYTRKYFISDYTDSACWTQ